MTQSCPACGTAVVPFTELPDSTRERLEADPDRQSQSVPHRRERHTVCPECEFEIHGCGQPYAVPETIAE
jgi:hypothetical protein